MVVNKVCRTLIATTSAITLVGSKTFFSRHICSTRMEKVSWSFSKVKN
jgi:hypothetical protein